ncbi:ABC transporter ATP-binding protein [Kocuria sp.]|uniref:ABC transporter ATP-binding protein n=1 Tax=Kocuria sp. TaxID=1871328 RepID=UPI0026E06D93|nr:ABC transporter ATP-binding protein [Kocuria sp.]MDO5617443.1 ABC transporter ATP-binding protein [Kocuria sp.]
MSGKSRGTANRIEKRALGRTLGLIRPHLGEHRWLIAGGVLALLLEVAFRVLEPWPLKILIDSISRSLGADATAVDTWIPEASWQLLLAAGLATVCIVGFRALTNYLATVAFALVGSRVSTVLRGQLFRHVQSLSDRFHSGSRAGDTVQRIVSDIGKLQEVAVTAGLPLLANVITLVVMCIVMLILDWMLALVVVGAILAFWLISRGSSGKITAASRKTRKGEGALANTAHESLGAIRVVQAYGLEERMARSFEKSNQLALTQGVQSRRLAAGLERSTDVIVGVATAIVLVGGGWRVLQEEMTLGDLVLFITYLKTCMKPLRDMAKYTGRIARAAASGERVADLMDTVPDIRDGADSAPLGAVRGEITFRRVDASYGDPKDPGRAMVLRDIDVVIPPGQHVSVIGPSGSGKSTLAALLVRSLDPAHGSVAVDGQDLRLLSLESVRANVALLLQESVLFHGTIRENIRLGREQATDAQVEAAAKAAQAHDFVLSFPDGYNTVVAERGSSLSGGQRQRIAIARALLRDAPVVVLDEATTGLDPQSTQAVVDAIAELIQGRTSLAVTHDAAMALASDRVLWVQDGRILLDGTPEELLADPHGVFAAWVAQQQARDGSEVQAQTSNSRAGLGADVVAGPAPDSREGHRGW